MAYDFKKFREESEKITEYLQAEYKSVQTGSASPQVLDMVTVEAYGAKMSIPHLATVFVESPENLLVSPYDKSLLKEIEKAINEADLGLSTSPDTASLRVFFPRPTTESRQKMVKVLKEKLEEARVKIRGVREEVKKDIEKKGKEGEFGKDEENRSLEGLQDLVNIANQNLEEAYLEKEKRVLGS